jgi:thiol-disulfide isomerase/thioredoxin
MNMTLLKNFSLLVAFIILAIPFKGMIENNEGIEQAQPSVPVLNFDAFQHMLHFDDDKTYIINFWATWCRPCIKELPFFEQIGEEYKDKNVEVILVSLDFPDRLETAVIPFINRHNLKSKVLILDDANQNRWIPLVSEKWSGAIPATLIYNKSERKFYEQAFTYNQLITELNTFL